MGLEAIILAGGLGTRLRKVVPNLPKPLAKVQDQPFLDLLLHQLATSKQIQKLILAVSYKAETIIDYYTTRGKKYSFPISFSVEGQPLGTGGAIKKALAQTKGSFILVMNGDSYVEFDIAQLVTHHLRKKQPITLVLTHQDDLQRYGNVLVDPLSCQVRAFREKSNATKSGLISTGVYLIDRNAFEGWPEKKSFSLEKDFFPARIQNGMSAFITHGKFIDIGLPESYKRAHNYLQNELKELQ
ncbi:MAG: nucleotidyltransferase family protein [Deltaproteobacteria bacterium]|nr:nucleotidyltransferase family protein [Deltaproteobacteria bacterium]